MSDLVSWELVQLRIWLAGFVLATGQTLLCLHEQTGNVLLPSVSIHVFFSELQKPTHRHAKVSTSETGERDKTPKAHLIISCPF